MQSIEPFLLLNGLAAGFMAIKWIVLTIIAGVFALNALYEGWRQPARKASKWMVIVAIPVSLLPVYPIVELASGYPSHFRSWFWYVAPWTVLAFAASLAAFFVRRRALRSGRALESEESQHPPKS